VVTASLLNGAAQGGDPQQAAALATPADSPAAAFEPASPSPARTPAPTPTPTPIPANMPTVFLDPGHGGSGSPGCVYEDICERDLVLSIALKAQKILTDAGYHVIMTRTEDKTVYLNDRVDLVNQSDADILVSIHINALENDAVTSGIETWYHPTHYEDSQALAQCVQDAVIKKTGAKDLGLKTSKSLIITAQTNIPSCLVETGFISSDTERPLLTRSDYQQKLAEGIARGIMDFFDQQ